MISLQKIDLTCHQVTLEETVVMVQHSLSSERSLGSQNDGDVATSPRLPGSCRTGFSHLGSPRPALSLDPRRYESHSNYQFTLFFLYLPLLGRWTLFFCSFGRVYFLPPVVVVGSTGRTNRCLLSDYEADSEC